LFFDIFYFLFTTFKGVTMRIYYFGELIEDTENPNFNKTKTEQTSLELELSEQKKQDKTKTGMEPMGDILKDLDLNLDSFRPSRMHHT
jgi:hypothetical protein